MGEVAQKPADSAPQVRALESYSGTAAADRARQSEVALIGRLVRYWLLRMCSSVIWMSRLVKASIKGC
jgi:hypothetical protein